MRRPSWFEPVDSVAEWIGLIGGLVAMLAIIGLGGVIVRDLANGTTTVGELLCLKPGEPCRYSFYRVRNDTDEAVEVHWCSHHCGKGDDWVGPTVFAAPGQTTASDFDGVLAMTAGKTWWEVRTGSGRRLGCFALDGHGRKRDGAVVRVSDVEPCSPGQDATPFTGLRA